MIEKNELKEFVQQNLPEDYFLTDITVSSSNDIVVEVDSESDVDLDFCATLTRKIEDRFPRDVDDYSLEVGSAGITSPFKVKRQYDKNIGSDIEVLTKGGEKQKGVLTACDGEGFTMTVEKMVKPEGAKRKIAVQEELKYAYSDIKYVKNIIKI